MEHEKSEFIKKVDSMGKELMDMIYEDKEKAFVIIACDESNHLSAIGGAKTQFPEMIFSFLTMDDVVEYAAGALKLILAAAYAYRKHLDGELEKGT